MVLGVMALYLVLLGIFSSGWLIPKELGHAWCSGADVYNGEKQVRIGWKAPLIIFTDIRQCGKRGVCCIVSDFYSWP